MRTTAGADTALLDVLRSLQRLRVRDGHRGAAAHRLPGAGTDGI